MIFLCKSAIEIEVRLFSKIQNIKGTRGNLKTSIEDKGFSLSHSNKNRCHSGIQNVVSKFLELISYKINLSGLFKNRFRFQIYSTSEFSDPNNIWSLRSVFIYNQRTDLDDIAHTYHQHIKKRM